MRQLFKFKSHLFRTTCRTAIGIDISSDSLRLVETSNHSGQIFIKKYVREVLAPGLFDDLTVNDVNALTQAMKILLKQVDLKSKQVVFALPDALVMTQILSLSKVFSSRELEELLIYEAEKIFPLPMNELCLDFAILGPSAQNQTHLDVLIAAARSIDLNSRCKAISAAGLEVSVVDLESHALMRAVSFIEQGRLVAQNGQLLTRDNVDSEFLLAIGLALRGDQC